MDPEPFTTPETVLAYLDALPDFASHSCSRLAGGAGNFAWRIHLKQSYRGLSTAVLKHAKDYVAVNRAIPYGIDRMKYELEALRTFHHLTAPSSSSSLIRVPEVFYADLDQHVLIMEDAGDLLSLKDFLGTAPPGSTRLALAPVIGIKLGDFLAMLHVEGKTNSAWRASFSRNEAARTLCAWRSMGRLADATKKHGTYSAEVEEVAQAMKKEILESEETFNMGDFWTGNVLVEVEPADGALPVLKALWVIDWELAKYGPASTDIGQFVAESWNIAALRQRDAGTVLLQSFETAYRSYINRSVAQSADKLVAWRERDAEVAVHAATHLIVWSQYTGWTDEVLSRFIPRATKFLVVAAATLKMDSAEDESTNVSWWPSTDTVA